MNSLEMRILSDENKVMVEEPQITGEPSTDSDSCSLGHGIKTLNFGRTYNPTVLELVRGNFKDDKIIVVDEKSEEESVDSESDYGMVVDHVEETIELDELEAGVNDNDSGDSWTGVDNEEGRNSGCRDDEEVISGGLGTSPGVYMDRYDSRVEVLSEGQAMFSVFGRRSWGYIGHGVERLGSDGEVSDFSAETEDEGVTHIRGDFSAPPHPSPNIY